MFPAVDQAKQSDGKQKAFMNAPDQLHEMFLMHKAFNQCIRAPAGKMTEEEKAEWLTRHSQAVTQRISELAGRVPWTWLIRHQESDAQNAHARVVELFDLAISVAQVLGMDATDVFEAYLKRDAASFMAQGML